MTNNEERFVKSNEKSDELKKANEKINDLENEITSLKDGKKEERFCWIVLSASLFDCCIFTVFKNWSAPICIIVIQCILLFVIGKRCGVEEVREIFDKLIFAFTKNKGE